MKKIFLVAFFAVLTSSLFAQSTKIKIRFIGATDNKVFVQLPVDGATFYANREERTFDKDSALVVNVPLAKITNLYIQNSRKTFRFLIEPGNVNLQLDLTKKTSNPIVFDGANAAGQLLVNSRLNVFYQDRARKYLQLDSTAAGAMKLLIAEREKAYKLVDELLSQQKISNVFYEEIKRDIKMDYVATASAMPMQLFFEAARPNSKVVLKQDFKDLWKKVYDENPFDDLGNLGTSEYYDYAEYYATTYLGIYLPQVNGTWVKPDYSKQDSILKSQYNGFANHFKGKTREHLMASFLLNQIFQQKYQLILVELLDDFSKQYPQSKYTALLRPKADEILVYHENAKSKFAAGQKFVPNYAKINSLDELTALYKGKTVFVDLWATWCGPCKVEFEHGEELEKFLKSKNAEMLYISMDKDAADQQWKEMIKYYKLAGDHIRVNETLLQNLMDKLWDGKGYSIPRYLILKDGELVEREALRPSDKDKLYQQIAKHL